MRKAKISELIDEKFSEFAKISGGNLYEKTQELRTQEQIDIANLEAIANANNAAKATNLKIKNDINYQILDAYWLLELQTNYYINTIQFESEIKSRIKALLRISFKNGIAGIYFDKEFKKFMIGAISNLETDYYGKLRKAKFIPLTESDLQFKQGELENKFTLTIEGEDIERLVYLKWGSAGISAWITIWKLCLIQKDLLTMINTDKFSYLKKFIRKSKAKIIDNSELEEYFNIYSPFITKYDESELKNKIEISSGAKDLQNPNVLVEYYKQVMGIYNALFGRRTNNDFKKERQITSEVSLTDENYETLERDWIDEFKTFTDVFNSKSKKDKINVIEEVRETESIEQSKDIEKMEGGENNDL